MPKIHSTHIYCPGLGNIIALCAICAGLASDIIICTMHNKWSACVWNSN